MVSSTQAASVLVALAESAELGPAFRQEAMRHLSWLPDYDWCGIYRLEGETLHLDAYVGNATDHARIPVGRGVCGAAVAENRNQIVEDVRELDNYLACSLETRSEIVVLIRANGTVLGQVDIDGHKLGAFDSSDEAFLISVAALIANRWD